LPAPRLLYAHGFASGPLSAKGRAIAEHLARRGLQLRLLEMRVPTPEALRLSSMINAVRWSIEVTDHTPMGTIVPIARASEQRAVCIGSSLGALAVARAAERDPRILATVLLAPAFRVAERWRKRIGEEAWAAWQRNGTMEYPDHATSGTLQVDFGFMTDCAEVDGDAAPDDARAAEGFGPRWPDVKVPTVIVHGTRDETVDVKLSRTFAKGRPHVRLVEVDDDHQLLGSLPNILREIDRVLAELGVA
jgi:pimeloyl-ACP methyl ester carboxylesterase